MERMGNHNRSLLHLKLKVARGAVVANFRKAVLAENKDAVLNGISAGRLKVYQRQGNQGSSSVSALENLDLSNQELLEVHRLVSGLGS